MQFQSNQDLHTKQKLVLTILKKTQQNKKTLQHPKKQNTKQNRNPTTGHSQTKQHPTLKCSLLWTSKMNPHCHDIHGHGVNRLKAGENTQLGRPGRKEREENVLRNFTLVQTHQC